MVFLSFSDNVGAFTYGIGVNAANLTRHDIDASNAKLAPMRQQRISNSILKSTMHDPGYKSPFIKDNTSSGLDSNNRLDYNKCTKKELMKFLVDRCLKSEFVIERMSKDEMVSALRKADKKPLFEGFLELPPELRNKIYDYIFTDPNGKPVPRIRPVTPAISRANAQLRTETVPVFFGKTFQTIIIGSTPARPKSQQRNTKRYIGFISKRQIDYFDFAARMDWIRHFRCFNFRHETHTYNRQTKVGSFKHERYMVKFSNNMRSVKTWVSDKRDREGLPRVQGGMQEITQLSSKGMNVENFTEVLEFFIACCDTVYTNTPV